MQPTLAKGWELLLCRKGENLAGLVRFLHLRQQIQFLLNPVEILSLNSLLNRTFHISGEGYDWLSFTIVTLI